MTYSSSILRSYQVCFAIIKMRIKATIYNLSHEIIIPLMSLTSYSEGFKNIYKILS